MKMRNQAAGRGPLVAALVASFFGGAAAARRGDLKLARERFAKLLSMNPPASVRPLIEQQVSALDEKLAGGAPAPAATTDPMLAPPK